MKGQSEMNTMKRTFDEEPKAIEVETDNGAAVAFYVRENIARVTVPAQEDGGEAREAWQADEFCATGLSVTGYGTLTSAIVRAKYSADAELAIQRQREAKPEEFEEYYVFCEAAKAAAKAAVEGADS